MSREERVEIGYLSGKGYGVRAIARALGRSASTVSDELRRNRVYGYYDPRKAQYKAYVRRKYAKYQGMKIAACAALRREIEYRLYDDQSPEAIAGCLKRQKKKTLYISKNAIYRYIASPYGRNIEIHRRSKRKRQYRKRSRIRFLSNRTFIDKRPKKINARKRIGDVEADFILSGRSGIGILVTVADRKSRASFLEQILHVTIARVHGALMRIKRRFPEIKTITTDNDILFERHRELEKLLQVKIYFCHPYHSWEKGTIENTNGIIRRDIPKGSDISRYSKIFIKSLEAKLNRRPMKILGFRSPQEILFVHRLRRANKKRRSDAGL